MTRAPTRRIDRLVEQIKPMLAGQGAPVQGAVLCELVATHLAGHFLPGDEEATDKLRENLLELHVDTVRKLIPVVFDQMMKRGPKQ